MSARTAIVTGSGRGIGKETAILLAERGVNVVVCSRTQREIDKTVDEIKDIHPNVLGVRCDVGNAPDVEMLVKKTVEKFGPRIDILVNNAGVAFLKRLEDTTEREWEETINSNLKKECVPVHKGRPALHGEKGWNHNQRQLWRRQGGI
jgi:3-oxoacyl-[acyl-carrier protein] reductase